MNEVDYLYMICLVLALIICSAVALIKRHVQSYCVLTQAQPGGIMTGAFGIDEIEKAVDVIAGIGNVGGGVFADNKVDLSDLNQLIPLGLVFKDALTLHPAILGKQLGDFQPDEREAIMSRFKTKFDIPQNELEAKIESGLSLLNRIVGVVDEVIVFAKSFKKPA